jgi:hypothetical protein
MIAEKGYDVCSEFLFQFSLLQMQNVPQHGMPAQQYGNTYGNQRGHGPMGIGNPNSAMTTMGNMGMGSMGGGMNGMNPMNSMANMGMMGQNGGMHGNMMGGMGPGSMGPGSMGPGSMPMNKMGMQVRHSHAVTWSDALSTLEVQICIRHKEVSFSFAVSSLLSSYLFVSYAEKLRSYLSPCLQGDFCL